MRVYGSVLLLESLFLRVYGNVLFFESVFGESLWVCCAFGDCFSRVVARFSLVSRDPFQEKNLEMLKKKSLSS